MTGSRISPSRPAVLLAALAVGTSLVASCYAPKGKIAADSHTDACRKELAGALGAFSRDLGLAYSAAPNDADAIFASGNVTKTYARDGVRHSCSFGVDADGCKLVFYEKSRSEPGKTSTTQGSYGSVALSSCRCAK